MFKLAHLVVELEFVTLVKQPVVMLTDILIDLYCLAVFLVLNVLLSDNSHSSYSGLGVDRV